MLQKMFITTLVLAALSVSLAGWMSFSRPLVQSLRLTPRFWVAGAVFDGRARLFWFSARDERILSIRRVRGPLIDIVSTHVPGFPEWHGRPAFATERHQVTLGNRWDVDSFGLVWRRAINLPDVPKTLVWYGFIRAPVLALVVALLVYPALALLRGPVRRRRRANRGLCAHCGYDMTGLLESRCPECGSPSWARLPDTRYGNRPIS